MVGLSAPRNGNGQADAKHIGMILANDIATWRIYVCNSVDALV
jgi:hypothetical protein